MTAPTASPARTSLSDDDIDHLYCCDENVAMCGADLTDTPDGPEFDEVCRLCLLAEQSGMPCPVPGCQP